MVSRVRSRGSVLMTISAIRALGPLLINITLSARRMASSTSWVIMNTVCRVAAQIFTSSSWITPRVSASSAPNGSSISSIFGSTAKARAMPTRCFMPPDSSAGFFCAAPVRPTISIKRAPCSAICWRDQDGCRDFTAKAMFCSTVSQGISACPWNTTPRSRLGPAISLPAMTTPPLLGSSRPASTLRMVLLPQPEWPITQTNSPCSRLKLMFSNTGGWLG